MISTVIWISSIEARSFRLNPAQIEERHFHSNESNRERHQHEKHSSDHFFREVAQALLTNNQERYLILGPGQAKSHFVSYLKQHNQAAAQRIVSVESIDKMTDGEILDFAHRFFRKIDTFEKLG
jgi:stalled ribosome rescue protein Dom34